MSVTREEVDRIAGLARLELGEEEAQGLRSDLNGILEHMETLADAPAGGRPSPGSEPEKGGSSRPAESDGGTTEVRRQAHRDGPAPFREDGEAEPDGLNVSPGEMAPRWEDGFFSVPRLPGLEDEASP